MVFCMLIMSGVQVHSSCYKDFTSVWILLCRTLNPTAWTCTASYMASELITLAWTSGRRKGRE